MKKLLCLILSLAIVFSFAACGRNEEISGEPKDEVITDTNIADNKDNQEKDEEISQQEKDDAKEDKKENNVSDNKKPSSNIDKPSDKEEKPSKTEISLSELGSSMVGVIPEGEHNLELIPSELYKDIYGVDKSLFSDCVIYGTMISVKANEIILIKVNNESDINKATEILEARKNQVYKTWEQYLPDQFEMVKKGVIKTNGKYAALIISPLVDKVSDKFIQLTK